MSGCRFSSSNYAEFRVGEPGNSQRNRVRVRRVQGLDRRAERTYSDADPVLVWPTAAAAAAAAATAVAAAATSAPAADDFLFLRKSNETQTSRKHIHTTVYVDVC